MTSDSGELHGLHYATGQPAVIRWSRGRVTDFLQVEGMRHDQWLAPGLLDLQINGYAGIDFQEDNIRVDELHHVVRELRNAGCTRFFLTLITDEWPRLTTRLRHLRGLRDQTPDLKHAIAGWHIEGPFISDEPGYHGAHNRTLSCDPDPNHIAELRQIVGADPLLITLSPERAGAIEAIRAAAKLGVVVSLGHTNASSNILAAACEAGATAFTHLANGCPQQLDRHDNILWRVSDIPQLFVSLIPDGIHVSPALFRLLHKVLNHDHIYYTTDAMAAAGAPPGKYKLQSLVFEVGQDQIVRKPGTQQFAGSALRPLDGVIRASKMLGVAWQQAWRRAAEVPARLMGLPDPFAVGEPINVCLLKHDASATPQIQHVIC